MKLKFRRGIAVAAAAALTTTLAPVSAGANPAYASTASSVAPAEIEIVEPGNEGDHEYLEWMNLLGENATIIWSYSPSMDRDIPLVWLHPEGKDKFAPRPILYTLNGAGGGQSDANWLAKTDIQEFFKDKDVNIVIPFDGFVSYYTDWVDHDTPLGTQYWETFLTKELPGPLEAAIGSDQHKRGLIGMSMSGTTSLLYAQHNPEMYEAVASYSGCAQTSDPFGQTFVELVVNRGEATGTQMWGPRDGDLWRYNDALVNADKLKGTATYVSNGSGIWDEFDEPAEYTLDGYMDVFPRRTTGSVIEMAVFGCSVALKSEMIRTGSDDRAVWNLRQTGTHEWDHWQEDLHDSWNRMFSHELY